MKHLLKAKIVIAASLLTACGPANGQETKPSESSQVSSGQTAEAIFAGGCFWCVEADFEKLPGVIEAISGYTGGHAENPTYKQVTRGGTGHYEAAKIIYNPGQISYSELVEHFWTTIDPTDNGGQFCDRGDSYRPAIFAGEDQIDIAEKSLATLKKSGRLSDPVKTPVLKASTFYDAEDYHQDYYKKNPIRYKYYRNGCGRDRRINTVWGNN
jgi:methionine-S-sulfoxide reductase